MKRLGRIVRGALVAAVVGYVAFLVDTTGEATLTMQGVVLESSGGTIHTTTGSVSNQQMLISIPGKTFWWNGSAPVGTKVGVEILDGRFSRWRYIWDVDASSLGALNRAFEEYDDAVKRIRDNSVLN